MKKAIPFVLITALCFATLEPVSGHIAANINPAAMTAIRFIIGGLILLPFAISAIKKQNIKISFKTIFSLFLLSVLLLGASMVPLQYAVLEAKKANLSTAVVAIIFCCNSVFTAIFSAIILKDKISLRSWVGIFLCLLGIVISSNITSGIGVLSVVLALISAITMGLYTVISKKFIKAIPGVVQNAFSFIMGGVALAVVLLILNNPVFPTSGNLTLNLGVLAYLGIVVTGIGYAAFFKAIEFGSATVASSAFLIKPVLAPFAALLVSLIFTGSAESIKWYVWAAIPLVFAGSILMLKPKVK
jgi:drug/metabolite transporter (DMT)-like permease